RLASFMAVLRISRYGSRGFFLLNYRLFKRCFEVLKASREIFTQPAGFMETRGPPFGRTHCWIFAGGTCPPPEGIRSDGQTDRTIGSGSSLEVIKNEKALDHRCLFTRVARTSSLCTTCCTSKTEHHPDPLQPGTNM